MLIRLWSLAFELLLELLKEYVLVVKNVNKINQKVNK